MTLKAVWYWLVRVFFIVQVPNITKWNAFSIQHQCGIKVCHGSFNDTESPPPITYCFLLCYISLYLPGRMQITMTYIFHFEPKHIFQGKFVFPVELCTFSLLAILCLRPWVRILHSAGDDDFDSKIACLYQSITINTANIYIYIYINRKIFLMIIWTFLCNYTFEVHGKSWCQHNGQVQCYAMASCWLYDYYFKCIPLVTSQCVLWHCTTCYTRAQLG